MLIAVRRGFTLAEVMLSVSVTVVVAGAIYNLLVTTQRVTRLQGERTLLQATVRAGSHVVFEELSELNTVVGGTADQNDIVAFGPTAVTYRAMRGIGFICQAPSPTTIRIARTTFTGHRDPQAGRDEVYIFVPGNPDAETRDSWVWARIVSVATAAPCPGGLGAGIALTVPAGASLGMLEPGTPVRITEVMELRLYQSDGRSWLGARSVGAGEAIQPLVGPLADAQGFRLEYLDGTGAATVDRTLIRSIRGTLRGTTDVGGAGPGAPVEEELITQVTLRNGLQP
ncbi:MAG: prepilin-type N-terminal cleavage/methylation domain-containing protein [Gemmatimonadota bacterium]|nr:prepilin-type N-terminal cleavage/methylation domain-containing protein [Gemmatimonadota bacterium]